MSLTLTLENIERLDNGEPTQLRLDRHGAVIGRSPHSDWSLPDAKNYVSSTHCEIDYSDGAYRLIDKSTNGTFLNGSTERLSAPQPLKDGDVISIGQYRVVVSGAGGGGGGSAGGAKEPAAPAAGAGGGWGWEAKPGAAPAAPPASSPGWDGAASGWDNSKASSTWDDNPAPEEAAEAAWGSAPAAPASSGWDSDGGAAPAASAGWDETPVAPVGGGWNASPAPPSMPGAGQAWAAPSSPNPGPRSMPGPGSGPGSGPISGPVSGPVSGPQSGWASASEWAPEGMDRAARPPASGWDALAPARDPASLVRADEAIAGSTAPISGRGMMAQNWAPPRVDSPLPPPLPAAPAAAPESDVWGAMAASNTVDWSRGGFGDAPPPAPPAPAAVIRPPPPAAPPAQAAYQPPAFAPSPIAPIAGAPPPAARPAPPPVVPGAPPAGADGAWTAFLTAAGLGAGLKSDPVSAATAAGGMMRRLVSGLVVMMEARARAKAQLGAQSTTLELKGNNPIKFARSPERVLAQLLDPPERGFMGATDAVEDSFRDLQAHQMATLAAMQGALRSTLDRFSPDAIRGRAEMRGVLAKILPGARDAALWNAYEREFEGVAKGSDEAFMDVFAKAFKAAYEQASAQMKSQAR